MAPDTDNAGLRVLAALSPKISVLMRILDPLVAAGYAALLLLVITGLSLYMWARCDTKDEVVGLTLVGSGVIIFAGCVSGYVYLKRPVPKTTTEYDILLAMIALRNRTD